MDSTSSSSGASTRGRRMRARLAEALDGAQRFPVVAALRTQGSRELVVAGRLAYPALLLEAAAEGEVRVVVDGRDLEHRPELPLGLGKAPDAKVREAERLADRGLRGLSPLRLLERHRRLGCVTGREVAASLLVEAVRLTHWSLHWKKDTESCGGRRRRGAAGASSTRARAPR